MTPCMLLLLAVQLPGDYAWPQAVPDKPAPAAVAQPVASVVPAAYADAWRTARDKGKPLVVMLSASWCPSCHVLQNNQLATWPRRTDIVFVVLDVDAHKEFCQQLGFSNSVPVILSWTNFDGQVGRRWVPTTPMVTEREIAVQLGLPLPPAQPRKYSRVFRRAK